MAWNDIAKVGKLLQSLQALDNGANAQQGGKKSGGKGGHKWTTATAEGFLCVWDDCLAAQNGVETWGGEPKC